MSAAERRSDYIPEIQGLRSLALALVVVYHVWFDRVSGGVDVFLMVSAYLMTRSVLGRRARGTGYNPVAFLIRRFSRLLPLAAATIALTVVASFAIFPVWRWPSMLADATASLLYFENHRLQEQLVDYYAVDPTVVSPFQHFWSLSVQGQVFVLWAVLLLIAWWVSRWLGWSLRALLAIGFGLVFAASMAWAVHGLQTAPERIYFDTEARLWEFAFGSLLAVLGALRVPAALRTGMNWLGLALIISTGWVFTAQGAFPGPAALWPLIGAGLIIVAATAERDATTPRAGLLAHPWLVRAGAFTYALYLVHWPVLVFAQVLTGENWLGPLTATVVFAISIGVSVVLTRLVDQPVERLAGKRAPIGRPLIAVAASAAVAGLLIGGADAASRPTVADDPGTVALGDWAVLDEDCTDHADAPTTPSAALPCIQTTGYADSDRRILMVGGSHVQQLMPAVLETAAANEWGVRAVLLPGCHFRDEPGIGREVACHALWQGVRTGEVGADADLVLTLAGRSTDDGGYEVHHGFGDWVLAAETALDARVLAVRDNPRFSTNIFACGQQYGVDSPDCSVELQPLWEEPLRVRPDVPVIDLTDRICPDGVCLPSQGEMLVFLDSNHLTATAARELLAAPLSEQLAAQLDWWRPAE